MHFRYRCVHIDDFGSARYGISFLCGYACYYFAVLPDASCQGLFHHIHGKVTFGLLPPGVDA